MWHYHESGCQWLFALDHVIGPMEPCPNCRTCFRPLRVYVACEACNRKYVSDVRHPVGTETICPLCGSRVVVKQLMVQDIREPGGDGHVPPSIGRVIIAVALVIMGSCCAIYAIVQGVDWFASAIATVVAFLGSIAMTVLLVLGLGLVGLLVLGILYLPIAIFAIRPIDEFDEIRRKVNDSKFSIGELGKDIVRQPQPQSLVDSRVVDEALDRSRSTILRQQLITGILVVVSAVGALFCYLSVKTLEQARQVVQETVQLGSVNIILFAIIFYSSKFFLKLDRVLASKGRFIKGLVLSLMFGVASVLTIIILPPLLGESTLSGSVIAITLTINVIVDVFLTSYEAIASICFEGIGALKIRLKSWLSPFTNGFGQLVGWLASRFTKGKTYHFSRHKENNQSRGK